MFLGGNGVGDETGGVVGALENFPAGSQYGREAGRKVSHRSQSPADN